MSLERAATRRRVAGRCHAEAGRLEHPLAGLVDVALPGIHHTAGEEVHVVAQMRRVGSWRSGS